MVALLCIAIFFDFHNNGHGSVAHHAYCNISILLACHPKPIRNIYSSSSVTSGFIGSSVRTNMVCKYNFSADP